MAMRCDMKPDMPAATVAKIILNYLVNAELFKKKREAYCFLNSVKNLEALIDTVNQSIHLYNQEV